MRESFGIVYQKVMRDSNLSAEAKCIYAYLASLSGNDGFCYPSIETMIKELNMSRNRINKHMDQLADAGIIVKDRMRNGNRFGRNIYRTISEEKIKVLYTQNEALENVALENVALENVALENVATTNNNTTNNNTTNNTLPNPSHGGKRVKKEPFVPPTPEEVTEYSKQLGYEISGDDFCNHYDSCGWMAGGRKMVDWKPKVRDWINRRKREASGGQDNKPKGKPGNQFNNFSQRDYDYNALERQLVNSDLGKSQ